MRLRLLPLLWLLLLLPAMAQAQTVLSDRSANGALTAAWNGTLPQPANTTALVSLPSQGCAAIQVTGTFVATLQFEALIDQKNATWIAVKGTPFTNGGTTVSSVAGTGAWVVPLGGVKVFRVRCSAYTSGTALVGIVASEAVNTVTIAGGGGGGGTATSVSAADEAAFTPGTDPFNPIGSLFNDSAAALTSGQVGIGRSTPNRAQHVNLRNNAGTEIGTSANPVRVDPTGTTPQPVTGTFFQATQPVSGTVTANAGTGPFPVAGAVASGAAVANPVIIGGQFGGNAKFLALDTVGAPTVNQGTANGAGANSWPVQGQTGAGNAVTGNPFALGGRDASGNVQFIGGGNSGVFAQGPAASGAAAAGNPLQEGGAAVVYGSAPTTVTAGQMTALYADRAGIPFSIGGHPDVKTFAVQYTAAQTDTAVVTIATGLKIVITSFMVTTSNANSVNTSCRLGFGTANTPAYGSNGLLGTDPNIAAGSGFGRGNGSGIIGVGADDEDLRFTCSVPTGGAVDVNVTYYTNPI